MLSDTLSIVAKTVLVFPLAFYCLGRTAQFYTLTHVGPKRRALKARLHEHFQNAGVLL